MSSDLIDRAARRMDWASRALDAASMDLRDADDPVAASVQAESERVGELVAAIRAVRAIPPDRRVRLPL